jgi:hypothetical protein
MWRLKGKITSADNQQNVEQCRPLYKGTRTNIEKAHSLFQGLKIRDSPNYDVEITCTPDKEERKCHV